MHKEPAPRKNLREAADDLGVTMLVSLNVAVRQLAASGLDAGLVGFGVRRREPAAFHDPAKPLHLLPRCGAKW